MWGLTFLKNVSHRVRNASSVLLEVGGGAIKS